MKKIIKLGLPATLLLISGYAAANTTTAAAPSGTQDQKHETATAVALITNGLPPLNVASTGYTGTLADTSGTTELVKFVVPGTGTAINCLDATPTDGASGTFDWKSASGSESLASDSNTVICAAAGKDLTIAGYMANPTVGNHVVTAKFTRYGN